MPTHDYNNPQHFIEEKNACLHVDVYCYTCKKLMAMSNAYQWDGRYYCARHIKPYQHDIRLPDGLEGE